MTKVVVFHRCEIILLVALSCLFGSNGISQCKAAEPKPDIIDLVNAIAPLMTPENCNVKNHAAIADILTAAKKRGADEDIIMDALKEQNRERKEQGKTYYWYAHIGSSQEFSLAVFYPGRGSNIVMLHFKVSPGGTVSPSGSESVPRSKPRL